MSNQIQTVNRGDVFWVNSSPCSIGSEQFYTRPGIIVSNEANNLFSPNVEIVYLTTADRKKPLPTHIPITSGQRRSTALCEAVYTVSKERLTNHYFTVSEKEMELIDAALCVSLGLSAPPAGKAAASGPSSSSEESQNIPSELSEKYAAAQRELDLLRAQLTVYEKICLAFASGKGGACEVPV